ncbi:hypothetical protein M513_04598 [Trichuris suis]|uniref:Uncharacterized protein n=1 Tax=Trichuris suis TaxID=68888 RepID=A0A085MB55_9BILA|nr:hypothetical protein M513_04598 [Trichuris suis]
MTIVAADLSPLAGDFGDMPFACTVHLSVDGSNSKYGDSGTPFRAVECKMSSAVVTIWRAFIFESVVD